MSVDRFDKLIAFLQRLDEARIAYSLKHSRPGGVTVNIDIPGERWEVDFLDDGEVDVERFVSDGEIQDESALEELFSREAENEPNTETVSHDEPSARK